LSAIVSLPHPGGPFKMIIIGFPYLFRNIIANIPAVGNRFLEMKKPQLVGLFVRSRNDSALEFLTSHLQGSSLPVFLET
jgi:hypothetical protein